MSMDRASCGGIGVRGGAVTSGTVEVADPGHHLAPKDRTWLEGRVLAAMGVLEVGGEVRAKIIDDAAMSEAHQRYSGIPGTTDVLTFDLGEGAAGGGGSGGEGVLDVDLLICIDEARRQATSRGHTPERELLLYLVHGMLHCLGHDDHDEARAAAMHKKEDEVLKAIGVGAVFSKGVGMSEA